MKRIVIACYFMGPIFYSLALVSSVGASKTLPDKYQSQAARKSAGIKIRNK